MGYDFLGTFTPSQWREMNNFLQTTIDTFEERFDPNDEMTIYLKHLLAEVSKARIEFELIERALTNYANFRGDVEIQKDVYRAPPRMRFKLSDGDTAYHMSMMKNTLRQVFKRKKDNLEYRYKRIFDLVEQMEDKFTEHTHMRNQYNFHSEFINSQLDDHFSDNIGAGRAYSDNLVDHANLPSYRDHKE